MDYKSSVIYSDIQTFTNNMMQSKFVNMKYCMCVLMCLWIFKIQIMKDTI